MVALVCRQGGDNARKPTSISAHPPPFLVRTVRFLSEGRCYLPPASPGFPEEPPEAQGRRWACARLWPGRTPQRGPVYQRRQPALTQHPPASSRHPGIATAADGTAGKLHGMLPQSAEGSGAPTWMAPQTWGEIPKAGNSLSKVWGLSHTGFGNRFQHGNSWASPEPCGGSSQRPSSVATCFSKRLDNGKYIPSASSCQHKLQRCPPCSYPAHFPCGNSSPG